MTATLLVIVPVALLVLIGSLYFVGCTLDSHGFGQAWLQYTELDILPNLDCVAYWPLSDSPAQPLALDVVGKQLDNPHHGQYRSVTSDPGLFPCPAYAVNAAIPITTAAAPGTQKIGAPGIVQGDTVPPHDKDNPILTTCMQCDGGFVSVEANSTCNPPVFSVECWVRPEWTAADAPASRQVIDSRNQVGAAKSGFGLLVNDGGHWQALIGHTGTGPFLEVTGGQAVLDKASHLVLTFDGSTAQLFVNGALSATQPLPAGTTFAPNTTQQMVFGVSSPYLPPRTKGATEPPPLFPILPFKGKIQDIAIYKAVLSDTLILTHWKHGNGDAAE